MTENPYLDKFDEFYKIVQRLRKECPWDREQTHESLRRCLLEESYEVLEAIDTKNKTELKKELGDLVLQVVFHTILAEEEKTFTFREVLELEIEKLISRHPHIFSDVKVKDADEVKSNWEKLKANEGRESILDGVPKELPASFAPIESRRKPQKWDLTGKMKNLFMIKYSKKLMN